MERLKGMVPLEPEAARHTTLGLLTKAKRFIKVTVIGAPLLTPRAEIYLLAVRYKLVALLKYMNCELSKILTINM